MITHLFLIFQMALNPIGVEGAAAILAGVKKNLAVKLVGLEGCLVIITYPYTGGGLLPAQSLHIPF